MLSHVMISVHGKVQGVGFRMGARHKAIQLGLTGWVRNVDDGTVSMEVEGDMAQIELFLTWCKEGTPLSQVERIETHQGEVQLWRQFEIL